MRETTDVNTKYVVWFGLALAVAGAVVLAGLWWMFTAFLSHDARSTVPQPSEPEAEANARDYIQKQNEILNGYGWIDRDKGIARIPIDRAVELLLERGVK